jgi:hypothetical protein
VVDGLRILFDFTLPIILLYASEQEQYEHVMKNTKPLDLLAERLVQLFFLFIDYLLIVLVFSFNTEANALVWFSSFYFFQVCLQ